LAVRELVAAGVRRLTVFCPAFVADCLETLEEIGIRARRDFEAAGGESLTLVPSLNANPAWVDAVVAMVRETECRTRVRADIRSEGQASAGATTDEMTHASLTPERPGRR